MGYRYLGSKARIVDEILQIVGSPDDSVNTFVDSLCGTGVVASRAADFGWNIVINDFMLYASLISESRLLSLHDVPFTDLGGYSSAVSILNTIPDVEGYITSEYSPESYEKSGIERRYFTAENARRIDAASEKIHSWLDEGVVNSKEFSLLISDVMLAANGVANIAGTYGCFLSHWSEQARNPLQIQPRTLRETSVNYCVFNTDVFEIPSSSSEVVYLDPPYTKRQYASYYHILETIARGDRPEVEGVSGLRPWEDHSSVFCYKKKALNALVELIIKQNAKSVFVSYSNEGHVDLDELTSKLNAYGETNVHPLGSIGRYRPNRVANDNGESVSEYLIEFRRNT